MRGKARTERDKETGRRTKNQRLKLKRRGIGTEVKPEDRQF